MADKIFRDPLYNYISIDKKDDDFAAEVAKAAGKR